MKIALLGYGTVGSATFQLLEERKQQIEKAINDTIQIEKILVRNKKKYLELGDLVTDKISDLVMDEYDLIIELTGAVDPIYPFIKEALGKGKDVITANKALVSKYFEKLHLAEKMGGGRLLYEAAVGGALPILSQIKTIVTLNEVETIEGVLNGTCNFILSHMEKGQDYEEALKEAQEKGFAEADPSADVDGWDTLRKISILSSLVFGRHIKEEEFTLEGITKVSQEELQQALEEGKRYKLMAIADKNENFTVGPKKVDKHSIFGQLEDGENAVLFSCSNAGSLAFKALGAGGKETAFSVLSDLIRLKK